MSIERLSDKTPETIEIQKSNTKHLSGRAGILSLLSAANEATNPPRPIVTVSFSKSMVLSLCSLAIFAPFSINTPFDINNSGKGFFGSEFLLTFIPLVAGCFLSDLQLSSLWNDF